MKLTVYVLNDDGEQVEVGSVTMSGGVAVPDTSGGLLGQLADSVNSYPDPKAAMQDFASRTGSYTRYELTE